MIYLEYYDESIGKTVQTVESYCDDSFDNPIEFTLISFTDGTRLLIREQSEWGARSGIIQPNDSGIEPATRRALNL